ncbi:carcinine transporter isoform X1 [Folsomia candida]|uniref:carcinine transporter isoform X1 n=1 Tax=Folsomia candida TaxID=158441 RepID=UPI001605053B|nr:carcinine transporter isoform X1 [Folsomia candida]
MTTPTEENEKQTLAFPDLDELYSKVSPEMEPLRKNGIIEGERKQDPRQKCTDFDDILSIVGADGKFQKILLYGVICPFIMISPFLVLNNIFLLDIPDHWCTVPGVTSDVDLETWKNLTISREIGPDGELRYSQCLMYDPSNPNVTMTCNLGWTYDKTDYETTIPSDFDWVCENMGHATDTFTVETIGSAVGTVVFAIMADNFLVAKNFLAFLTFQTLAGMAYPSIFNMPLLIVAEVCGSEYRAWAYAVTWMIWVVGNSVLPLVAWACRTWQLFAIVSVIPGFFLFLFYPWISESPRWLLTMGRGREALQIIRKIAKTNGVEIDHEEMPAMVEDLVQKQKEDRSSRNVGVWTLFQNYRLAKNTIFLALAWSMNNLLYNGVTLNTTSMDGNKFLNYFLLSIIELPSGYLAGVLVEKTGRRWTQVGFFLMCVISCAICAVAVVQTGAEYVVIAGALGIKFGITITSMVVYLQGVEIFPTQLRSTGAGVASTTSSILGIMGPYIIFMGKFNATLPYIMLGVISAVGLVASAGLPETFRQHLPETVEAANKFGKGVPFWSYLPKPRHDGVADKDNSNKNGEIEKLKGNSDD